MELRGRQVRHQPGRRRGRDSWDTLERAIQKRKPDVQVGAELWPKLLAGEYSAEISRLLTAKPDVIHSSFWDGDVLTDDCSTTERGESPSRGREDQP